MTGEPIDYLDLTRKALRGVMADSLSHAIEHGLSGEQHFYITFRTTLRGVVMPDWLLAQYSEEMTIVLQHEFWELAVLPDRFTVGLSFSGRNVTLVIPFAAVKTFADPSVNFQLDIPPGGLEQEEGSRALVVVEDESDALPDGNLSAETDETVKDEPPSEATVVSLDAFRKK
jgi:hypothetical protein